MLRPPAGGTGLSFQYATSATPPNSFELLGFLSDWLEGGDADLLANSLNRFVGNQA
jgi:hypothetical protein